MGNHALSEEAKSQRDGRKDEARMQEAIAVWKQEQEKPEHSRRGFRSVATEFKVQHTTLRNRVRGGMSMHEFNAAKQKLAPAEEEVIVQFAMGAADQGFPISLRKLEAHANALLKVKFGSNFEPVGQNWSDRFMTRHRKALGTHWSKALDTQRAQALNPENVAHWFALVKEHIVDPGIEPENIYGMDESGFPPSTEATEKVIGRRGTKTQHKTGGADRENITGIITISADGSVLRPAIIFKGVNAQAAWGQNNVSKAAISCSPNGWIDHELALEWIEKVFDAETKEKAAGKTRVLLMDGHSSHFTPELLRYAMANNIVILGYPPHCTHALQGLDVVCFARMKKLYQQELNAYEEANRGTHVKKATFAGVFGKAFLVAFNVETIKAAFAATGIHPYDPTVIKPVQMKPAEATSTKGSFPMPLPSPVRAIMAVYRYGAVPEASSEDDDTDDNMLPTFDGDSTEPGPSRKRQRPIDASIDPLLYTPTKRMRIFNNAMAGTSSGSFLIGKPKINSTHQIAEPVYENVHHLPSPDWTLLTPRPPVQNQTRAALKAQVAELNTSLQRAREQNVAQAMVIESSHAQLTMYSMFNERLSEALYKKETKEPTDRSVVKSLAGKGRMYTDEVWVAGVEDDRDKRREKEAGVGQRKDARAQRKLRKEAAGREWVEIKQRHNVAVGEWEMACEKAVLERVLKKDLPKKPIRAKKPKPVVEEEEDEDDDEDNVFD